MQHNTTNPETSLSGYVNLFEKYKDQPEVIHDLMIVTTAAAASVIRDAHHLRNLKNAYKISPSDALLIHVLAFSCEEDKGPESTFMKRVNKFFSEIKEKNIIQELYDGVRDMKEKLDKMNA